MSMSELVVVVAVSAVVAAVAAKVLLLWFERTGGVAVESYVCHTNQLTGQGQSRTDEPENSPREKERNDQTKP